MVEVKNGEITIKLSGDLEDLQYMQSAIIYLVQGFNQDFDTSNNEPFASAMNLLEAMQPSWEQLKKGFDATETNQ